MSDLNEFAPYPKTEDEVTAEAIIRTGLVAAWANDARARSALRERTLAMDMVALAFGEAATEQFHVASLLAELAKVAPERAEAAARRIWWQRFDGAVVYELTFERLAALGIDPNAVASLVETSWADAAEKRAQPPAPTNPQKENRVTGPKTRPPLDLGAIELRAAYLYEHMPLPAEAKQLTNQVAGKDVPALVAELKQVCAEVADLQEDVDKLRALEAAGVDNWDGYGLAMEQLPD